MRQSILYLVNISSTNGTKVLKKIIKKNLDFLILKKNTNIKDVITSNLEKGISHFVICGGDGTINRVVSEYMCINSKDRRNVKFSIIACGKANDLANNLNDIYSKKDVKEHTMDIIQVNNNFLLTGGGFGFPSEVVKSIEKSKIKIVKSKVFKDLIYYIHVIKKIFLGYKAIKTVYVDGESVNFNLMLLSITNQSFIGKRFHLSPSSKNDDGMFELCIIPKPLTLLSNIKIVNKVIKGIHIQDSNINIIHKKKAIFLFDQKTDFMADGEILEKNNKFKISTIPKSITFIHHSHIK